MIKILKATFLLIMFALLTFSIKTSYAQCVANAGADSTLCTGDSLNFILGGTPTATNGTPPYQYAWSTIYETSSHTYTASYFLNDTTLANPKLLNTAIYSDSLIFQLTVTDSLGQTCIDSITINLSQYIWLLNDKIEYINRGDSVQLYLSIFGGIEPISYFWSPVESLSDPTNPFTYASPDTSTIYNLLVTDDGGCTGTDIFYVYTNPTGIFSNEVNSIPITISPHPLTDVSILEIPLKGFSNLTFQIFDSSGKKVKQMEIDNKRTLISKSGLQKGIYFYNLFDGLNQIGHGKLVVD